VRFEAGTHVGYRFTSTGAIIGSKAVTLPGPSGASATRRYYVPGRGMYLAISNGLWAGYAIRESPVAYVIGLVANTPYSPPQRITFPAGTVLGYRFTASWQLSSARVGTLGHVSGASAGRLAVINGVRYFEIIDGGWAGSWVPAIGLATKALDCRTGPRATGGMQTLRAIPNAGPEVALTFDMGGRVDPAMQILRTLLLNGVCSTIFPTGAMSQTTVGAQVLAFVRAYPRLFEVGNHTMHHCDLVSGGGGSPTTAPCPVTPPSTPFIQKELTDAAAIIAAGSGQQPIPYWRPPYGSINTAVLNAAAGVGYTKTLLWDVDTIDWKQVVDGGPTAEQIATKVATRAVYGSTVLMHLGGWNTANALPSMIYRLRGRGLALSTVSDLMDGS
jgi:peptidoglycan/xylan/chitin deacetylase (PgdA/CDA1 family)